MARDKTSEQISATVSPEDKEWIEQKAEEYGDLRPNKSAVIRDAINALREQQEGGA